MPSALLTKFEKFIGKPLKAGRNIAKGFPFDVEDQDPEEGGITVTAVDRDAAVGLLKELRSAGFKTRRVSNTDFVIEASHKVPIKASVSRQVAEKLKVGDEIKTLYGALGVITKIKAYPQVDGQDQYGITLDDGKVVVLDAGEAVSLLGNKRASVKLSHRATAVAATSRRVRYLRRKYGPQIAAQPPKVGTEVQSMTGKRCAVTAYKAGRAVLSNGRNVSLEQLTRDYGWSGKCSITCADDPNTYAMKPYAPSTGRWTFPDSNAASAFSNDARVAGFKTWDYYDRNTKGPADMGVRAYKDEEGALAAMLKKYKAKKSSVGASVRASNGQSALKPLTFEIPKTDQSINMVPELANLGAHLKKVKRNETRTDGWWVAYTYEVPVDKLAAIKSVLKKYKAESIKASVRASNGQPAESTGKLAMDFPSEDQARAFASKAMSVSGARVTCSGKSVSVSYPASAARSVVAAAHASHGKAGAVSADFPANVTVGEHVDLPGGDTGTVEQIINMVATVRRQSDGKMLRLPASKLQLVRASIKAASPSQSTYVVVSDITGKQHLQFSV